MMKAVAFWKNLALISLICVWLAPGPAMATNSLHEPDELLKSPTLDLGHAIYALDLYAAILAKAQPPLAPILTRLARTCFLIGELTVPSQKHKYYEKGKTYAEMLLKEQPTRVEGHYWLALHLCGLADTGGALVGRRLLPQIMKELQQAESIDETYDQAGCHRVLGRIYFEAPAWPFSIGDIQKSLKHLNRAVQLAPDNSTNHLYLAETLMRLNRPEQARQELLRVLKCSHNALLAKGLEDDRQQAKKLLAVIKASSEDN